MATKNVFVFRTQFDSSNAWFLRELLYKNMIWLLGSLQLFLCDYVVCLFGMILNFADRFQVGGDGKGERCCEIDGFREELTNFLFLSYEDVFEDFGIVEEKTQSSSFMEAISVVEEEKENFEGGGTLLMEVRSEFQENKKEERERERERETESPVLMKACSDNPEEKNESEGGVSMEFHSDSHENKEKKLETESCVPEVHFDETEESVSQEVQFDQTEDGNKKETKSESSFSLNVHCDLPEIKKEAEPDGPVSMGDHSDSNENEGKEEPMSFNGAETSCVLMEANFATTTQKYQHVSSTDISGFMEEPTSMRFTFKEFFVGPNVPVIFYNNAEIIAQKQESSEHPKEEEDEDDDAESNQENEFLGCNDSQKGIESESNLMEGRNERPEESAKERSNEEQEHKHREKAEEWKKMMEELEHEVGNEWKMEWEHDDIVEQLKVELRNARQGGLSTILEEQEEKEEEEEEEDDEEELEETGETEHAEEVGDQKLQNNEENEELKDQMDEIEEVYQIYEDKMRKLDLLNYQTMHGLGLLQLKDSSKSSFKGLKPLISQNLWPRKEPKSPLMKLVQELQRDLEVVYVGQVCLSWEILCWLHKKALQLKQDSLHLHHHPLHFNVAAGEFQLFQVLLQRFIENEAFQGPRTLNFVKNRCVIRNLLQVPAIRDDSTKEKNITKGDEEEYVVSIARLAEIIKESMWLFWRFMRADKEDCNLILKVSQQTRTDHPKEPAISDLVKDIKAHLHKKEKKLKDLVRTGNCIVRKFQKHQQQQEDQLNHDQLLAQVELKLVSRVLNLSKLRKEHLIWCNEKLRRIKFVMKKKKVVVEPSFLLFPC